LVPDTTEVRVLGTQHTRECMVEVARCGAEPLGDLLPQEVAQLLRRVGMTARDAQHAIDKRTVDAAVGSSEPLVQERREEIGSDDVDLHLLCASPERLAVGAADVPPPRPPSPR